MVPVDARRFTADVALLTHLEGTVGNANERVIVLANRAPVRHERCGGRVVSTRSASGLVTALEPLLEKYSGTWVAHAAGSADTDVVDTLGGIDVPPANPRYRVRYVPLRTGEFQGYYYGFANEGLWPLCHTAGVAPTFRRGDFEKYREVNAKFASVVADEAGDDPSIVLVQDYHFALAPRIIRQRLPHSKVLAFWHIPWPRPRVFRSCPWAAELIDGLLGSDIVGLQTDDDCRNFLACAESLPGVSVDLLQGIIEHSNGTTVVRAYPVGVDCDNEALQSAPDAADCREWVNRTLNLPPNIRLGVGIDRMDYTKGIAEKFLAIERLLEMHPGLAGQFAFVQIAEPSRDCLSAYRAARAQALATCERINARFANAACPPIIFLEHHHGPADVYRYYKAADFCYVSSLHDGMNLVAKEFVAARDDERGVLVLSQFAGAAQQLRAALVVNPRRIEQSADALAEALRMPAIEQAKRMRILRAEVTSADASWWAAQLIGDVRRVAEPAPAFTQAEVEAWSPAMA